MITYAREDKEFALRLAKSLRQARASVWIDQLDIHPGQRWDDAVESALKECAGLILILSPSSVRSENVMDEVSYALEVGKQVVPILHLPCDIPFRLRRVQYLDFTGDYDQSIEHLVAALGNAGSSPEQSGSTVPAATYPHPPPAGRATDRRAKTALSWQSRFVGTLGGALLGGFVGAVMVGIPWAQRGSDIYIKWQGFDYGNPVVFMIITVGVAGAISGTDVRAIVYAVAGLGAGFLLFTFLNAALFIVEEGLLLLPLGAITGAIIGRMKARAKPRSDYP